MTSREPAKASSGKLDFSIDSLVGTSDCNKVTKSTVAVNGSQMTKDSSQSKESETKPNRNGSAFTQPSSSVIWNPNAGAGVMDYASPFTTQLGLLKNNFLSQAAAANSILLSSQSANPVNFCYSELSKQQQQQNQNGSLWQSNPYFLEVLQKSGVFPSTPYSRFCHGQELAHPGVYHPYRKPKRIRTAFSPTQLLVLERSFDRNHYVVGTERKDLAKSLGLSETQVKVWFQNRRTKFKRQKNEDDSKKSHASTECGSTKSSSRKHHDKESSTAVTSSGSTNGPVLAKGSNLVDDDRPSSLNVEDDDELDDDDEMIDDENDNESLADVSN